LDLRESFGKHEGVRCLEKQEVREEIERSLLMEANVSDLFA
jgi:hypothetical protein